MATAAAISLGILLFAAAEQLLAVAVFVLYCRRQAQTFSGDEPAVLVILPVRGADETLADCVQALARQDYIDFRIRVILDSRSDPGWRIVDQVMQSHPDMPIELRQLGTPRSTCSLKCSAVYEATEDLDDCEIVALIDSDIVPHKTWLRELVAPLADEKVGVSHGNRWYLPQVGQWGSLLRYCWNAVAVVTMHLWEMPWGGSLAIKRRVLEETDIRERWLSAGCEDVPLVSAVKQRKLKTRFVPSLIMKDREETNIADCMPFLDRQLLWARLYHPWCWWTSNLWQVVVAAAMITAVLCVITGAVLASFDVLVMGALALAIPTTVAILLLRWIEQTLLTNEQGPVSRQPFKSFLAIALTNVAMLRVIFISLFTRVIHWRGITYRVAGPWDLKMVEYHPYETENTIEPETDLTGAYPTV